ncbi:right-handed parallel beta-helix repeat-containing protein [Fontivita pretiosa]|uniref:right-handed parallel beta-helix repeat-containing protein n=1 Tax=Fontivita pretiosa TaxID=2989684 RepID=UPI003D185E9D
MSTPLRAQYDRSAFGFAAGAGLAGRRCIWLLLLGLGLTASLDAQAPAAAGPGSAGKVGPQTEAVDLSRYARVIYVSQTTGSDAADGSGEKPLASIEAAMSQARDASADKRCAILVSAGVYGGATVELKPYVDLYGGFDPDNWSRDIFAHASVIDGENTRRPVVGADHARIDGFVIRNGRADGHGGGILCRRSSPVISNNIIIENLAVEPADYVWGLFHQVGHDGGGIACIDGANPLITNNIIARNRTNVGNGGGIAARNLSLPIIENNVIVENRTGLKDNDPDKKKRARSSNGGGISLSHASALTSRARVAGNVILGNRVGGNSDAGGIYCEYDSSAEIVGNWIVNNTAEDDGGGMYVMKSSEPLLAQNVFAGNVGGALRLSKEGRARIHDNLFVASAGVITCVDSWMLLANNTIADSPGGAISYSNARYSHIRPSVVMNNIFAGSDPPAATAADGSELLVMKSNFAGDPLFVNDGVQGQFKSISYDAARVQSRVELASSISRPGRLVGRIIRIAQRWGVIADASGNELTVWGDVRGETGGAGQFQILPSYRLSEQSPCLGKAAALPAAPADTPPTQLKVDLSPRNLGANLMRE